MGQGAGADYSYRTVCLIRGAMRVSVTYVGELQTGYELPEQLIVVTVQRDQVAGVAEGHFKKICREVDTKPSGLFGEFLGATVHIARYEVCVRSPVGEDCNLVDCDNVSAVNDSFGALLNKQRDGVFQPRSIRM